MLQNTLSQTHISQVNRLKALSCYVALFSKLNFNLVFTSKVSKEGNVFIIMCILRTYHSIGSPSIPVKWIQYFTLKSFWLKIRMYRKSWEVKKQFWTFKSTSHFKTMLLQQLIPQIFIFTGKYNNALLKVWWNIVAYLYLLFGWQCNKLKGR